MRGCRVRGGKVYLASDRSRASYTATRPQVLVEARCVEPDRGGRVLKPLRVRRSRADSSCNTILPAVDQFTVPFAPRPPGPSGGRLAFQGTAQPSPARSSPPSGPREFTLQYDFDNGVMGRHAGVLGQILNQTRASKATRVRITGYRGATRLSDGRVMTERPDIGARRAREVADLLREAASTGAADPRSVAGQPEAADASTIGGRDARPWAWNPNSTACPYRGAPVQRAGSRPLFRSGPKLRRRRDSTITVK